MAGGYGNLNLGNLAMALRMTGAEPRDELLEQLRQQQTQPQQAPALPADTQKALEMTGGKFRVPAEEPRPQESMREREAAIPGNPYPEAVSGRDFNPRASSGTLQRERTEHMNEALDLKERQGEIASEGMDRQARAAGELEQSRREGIAATRQRVEQNRTEKLQFEQQANERLARITAMVDKGPPQPGVGAKVMQIIGAVMSAAGGPEAGLGRGMAMLGQSMAGDKDGWLREIQANQSVHQQLMQAAQAQNADSSAEIGVEQGLQELNAGVYNAELERIKAETNSQEVKRVASELQNGLRSQFVDAELQKRGTAQRTRGDDVLWRMPMDQLAEQIAAGNVGKHGQEIYQQRAKASQGVRKGEAELEQTAAETEKLRRGNAGGAGEEVVPGYVATVELGPADKTAIRANASATADIVSDLGKLRAIRERNDGGTWNANDVSEAKGIMGRMSTKLSQMNGAGAPSESERELFMESLTDPTGFYWRKDPIELYDRQARGFRESFESRMRSIGVVPGGAREGAAGLGFNEDKATSKEQPPQDEERRPLRVRDQLLSRSVTRGR
ncbi:MAG TPA: hypothetical protein VFZ61_03645 [Polyangiales bacterium]